MDSAEFAGAEALRAGADHARAATIAATHGFLDTEREELLVEAARLHHLEEPPPPPTEAFADDDTESETSGDRGPSPLASLLPREPADFESAHSLPEKPLTAEADYGQQPPSLEDDKWHQSSEEYRPHFSFVEEKPLIPVVENLVRIAEPVEEHTSLSEETPRRPPMEERSHAPAEAQKPPAESPLAVGDEVAPSPLASPAPPPPSPAPPKPEPAAALPVLSEEPIRLTCSLPKVAPPKDPRDDIPDVMEAELIFRRMGLDAWFDPARLHPKVESLVYWRDPARSGAALGGGLALLLALACCSLISVTAWLALLALAAAVAFRVYRGVLTAVRKTPDGHPFAEWLERDVRVPPERAQHLAAAAVAHLNAAVEELRRLFLVEDLVDSLRFGVVLWVLTYIGAAFNGITLLILGYIALFTLPKAYEANKAQVDANLDLARAKIKDITDKVRAAVPLGKKVESEKDK